MVERFRAQSWKQGPTFDKGTTVLGLHIKIKVQISGVKGPGDYPPVYDGVDKKVYDYGKDTENDKRSEDENSPEKAVKDRRFLQTSRFIFFWRRGLLYCCRGGGVALEFEFDSDSEWKRGPFDFVVEENPRLEGLSPSKKTSRAIL